MSSFACVEADGDGLASAYEEDELADFVLLFEDLKLLRTEEEDLVDSMSDPSETPLPEKAAKEDACGWDEPVD